MTTFIEFFKRLPSGADPEFTMFSFTHFIVFIISIIIIWLFFKIIPIIKESPYEKIIRYTFGISLLFTNVVLWIYSYNLGTEWYHYLPIATCGWSVYSGGLALLTKNKTLFKITLFWGFGAILTILGPSVIEGPNKYNFYQFFYRHLGIILSAFYLMHVFDYKITKKDFKLFLVITISLTIASSIINYIVNKPDELNMFYTMQPAINGTPLNWFYDISRYLYIAVWLPSAALLGYLYGLLFYKEEE